MNGLTNGFPDCAVRVEPRHDAFQPYDHQTAAWNNLDRHFQRDKKMAGVLVVPTGGGKTAIAARWLLERNLRQEGRILWLTHRRGLLLQAFEAFRRNAHLTAPREALRLIAVSGEDRPWSAVSKHHDVVFSTIQSAALSARRSFLELLAHQSPKGLFVVVDEAHHAASPSYQRVLKMLRELGCPLLGLTATPVRMGAGDNSRLWKVFEAIVEKQVEKKDLIEKGILAKPILETVQTNVEFEREFTEADLAHLKRFGDLGTQVLEKIAKHSKRNHLIVEHYVKSSEKYGKTIVFAVDTLHARTLVKEFQDKGVDADYVDYTRRDSDAVMDSFRDGDKPRVLVNVEMLTEGYDAPRTQTVLLARPTKSESLLSQMIGRALRGTRAGGTAEAHLVTFVDTWKDFHPLDAVYVVGPDVVEDPAVAGQRLPAKLVPIALDLILECYRLVRSNVRGDFVGIYQCLPHSMFVWEEEFEDDHQRRTVMVFENQVEGFRRLQVDYSAGDSVPEAIEEHLARDLVRRYFGDCQDPLPPWPDVKALLDAWRQGLPVDSYTFEEKRAFDPATLARQILDDDLRETEKIAKLKGIWEADPVCRLVYRNDFKSFVEDVEREVVRIRSERGPTPLPPITPPVLPPTETSATPRPWPEGETGHQLGAIWDAVTSQKRHFKEGVPELRSIFYSKRPLASAWGWFRYSDKALCVNCTLNSPDVPLFVVEFLVYHEALHADMPNSDHNRDFRQRERRFNPSPGAIEDAESRGMRPAPGPEGWYALADQFLDTFERHYRPAEGGKPMTL